MKLILPKVELVEQEPGIQGVWKAIAQAGHICYASEKIGDEKEFIDRCIKLHHYRPLEFGTIYLTIAKRDENFKNLFDFYTTNRYSKVWIKLDSDTMQITTNYRVIIENNRQWDLQYRVDIPNMHFKRYMFHWTIARGIADEFRTHTMISSLMQSTRYCDYSKDKFGNELTFVKPHWISNCDYNQVPENERIYFRNLEHVEYDYLHLKQLGYKAEQVRDILPLSIKTEFIQCAFEEDWNSFFEQRVNGYTGVPHPDAKLIAEQAYEYYKIAKSRDE